MMNNWDMTNKMWHALGKFQPMKVCEYIVSLVKTCVCMYIYIYAPNHMIQYNIYIITVYTYTHIYIYIYEIRVNKQFTVRPQLSFSANILALAFFCQVHPASQLVR